MATENIPQEVIKAIDAVEPIGDCHIKYMGKIGKVDYYTKLSNKGGKIWVPLLYAYYGNNAKEVDPIDAKHINRLLIGFNEYQ